MNVMPPGDHDIARTFALLGGTEAIARPVRNSLDAHDLIVAGLPAVTLVHLAREVGNLATAEGWLEKSVGISLRTLQRRRKDAEEAVLTTEQSSRIWKFAEILGRAEAVFGSIEAAETWMNAPAIGLDRRKPIDLMATSVGIGAVEDYLTRIEFGVYA